MRCLDCGYVSFDHLAACRRCAKPLSANPWHALPAAMPSPADPFPSGPPVITSQVKVQQGWGWSKDRSALEGELSGDELDWTRLSLPAELRPPSPSSDLSGGLFRRAIAVLVDAPLLLTLTLLAMTLASLTAVGGGMVAGEVTRQVTLLASGSAFVAAFVVSAAYHVLWWGQGGQTPGKMLVGLAVVGDDGEEIGYGRAFLRWVAYLLAMLPLGLGLALALFHPRRRGLHDLLAGTRVVRVYGETWQ